VWYKLSTNTEEAVGEIKVPALKWGTYTESAGLMLSDDKAVSQNFVDTQRMGAA